MTEDAEEMPKARQQPTLAELEADRLARQAQAQVRHGTTTELERVLEQARTGTMRSGSSVLGGTLTAGEREAGRLAEIRMGNLVRQQEQTDRDPAPGDPDIVASVARTAEELRAWQEHWEEHADTEGKRLFRKRLRKASGRDAKGSKKGGTATTLGAERQLLRGEFALIEQAITAMCKRPRGDKWGAQHCGVRWYKKVTPASAATIALTVVLDSIALDMPLTQAALEITTRIFDLLKWRRLQKKRKGLAKFILRDVAAANYAHKSRTMNARLGYTDIDISDLDDTPKHRVQIGAKLIEIVENETGYIEIVPQWVEHFRRKRRPPKIIRVTAGTAAWLAKTNGVLAGLHPEILPMVIPPTDWQPQRQQPDGTRTPAVRGGYIGLQREKYPIIRRASAAAEDEFTKVDLPLVYGALAQLQQSAWCVNDRVLTVIEALRARGGGVAGLPLSDRTEPPTRPADMDDPKVLKRWTKQAKQVWRTNESVLPKARRKVDAILKVATLMRQEPHLFFPHSLDFRSRMYPIAGLFHPQGSEMVRALLTFSGKGKVLDAAGVRWLANHGAQCFGKTLEGKGRRLGSLTFEERVNWVKANERHIIAAATDPADTSWWSLAKKPLMFLAFCFAWADYTRAIARGEAAWCSLPVYIDGSCNGVAHWAALLADPKSGAATNVRPPDDPRAGPQDLYADLAEAVLTRLATMGGKGDLLATRWLGLHLKLDLIDRALLKAPTMQFGYGAKPQALAGKLITYFQEEMDEGTLETIEAHFAEPDPESDTGELKSGLFMACVTLGKAIAASLQEEVPAAFAGMQWIQAAAAGIAMQGHDMRWEAPDGFPVVQRYVEMEGLQVNCGLMGTLVLQHPTAEIDVPGQVRGVAPNYIHSLDGYMARLALSYARQGGIGPVSTIHDSFGCLPTDMPLLHQACLQAMGTLYAGQDPIGRLWTAVQEQWPACPEPPARAELDTSRVRASAYLFN